MTQTPNKGYTLLEDGKVDNRLTLATDLQLMDATLNLILEDVYEGSASPLTPTNLQPGQAWFISNDSTLSGTWGQAFGTAPGSRGGDIIAIWATNPSTPLDIPEDYLWMSAPVPTTAYGYILSRGGRYQFNPNTQLWEEQTKLQVSTWSKSLPAGLPLTAGADFKYVVMTAPFDMQITDISFSTLTAPAGNGSYHPEGALPRIAHSSNPNDPFSSWTTLVKPGASDQLSAEANWGPAGGGLGVSLLANLSVLGSIPADGVDFNGNNPPWQTAVISARDTIAVGGPWTVGDGYRATSSPDKVRNWELKITYVQI